MGRRGSWQVFLMTADDPTGATASSQETPETHHRTWSTGVSSTVWVFAFLILRIFAVSGYSWETAFLVSNTISLNDGLAILFGSLMAGHLLVPSSWCSYCPYSWRRWYGSPRPDDW